MEDKNTIATPPQTLIEWMDENPPHGDDYEWRRTQALMARYNFLEIVAAQIHECARAEMLLTWNPWDYKGRVYDLEDHSIHAPELAMLVKPGEPY